MTKFLSILFLLLITNAHSQITFEKGYIITDKNERIECLIKNQDWMDTPKQVEYKLTESSTIEIINFNQMITFQVYNTSQYYQKHSVSVDRKNDQANFDPKPETTVLKVLVEGNASLYSDNDGIFFYKKENGEIKQLVYKKYNDGQFIKENTSFRNELYENLKCENNLSIIRKLKYYKKNLIKFFKEYNDCKKAPYKIFSDEDTKLKFNFGITAGLTFNDDKFSTPISFKQPPSVGQGYQEQNNTLKSGNKASFAVGFEAEMLLPFNKNKWSVFVAPNYQQNSFAFSQNITSPFLMAAGTLNVKNDYSFIDIPVGVRHYFNLNQNNMIFIDAAYSFGFSTTTTEKISFVTTTDHIIPETKNETGTSSATRLGLGYKYNNKYSLSLNYSSPRKISQSEISGFSLVATYKLF